MLRAGCFLLAVLAFAAIQVQGEIVRGRLKKATTVDESGELIIRLERFIVRFSR